MSAEYNGIRATLAQWHPDRVEHMLVHTDTVIGGKAVQIVKDLLVSQGNTVHLLSAGGLRTDDLAGFREALADLTRKFEEWIPDYRRQKYKVIFNLTGGFKSLNAYLQALGMIHADHCVFIFERASELMQIPRLPIKLVERDELRAYLPLFRRIAMGYNVSIQETQGVPEALLLIQGDAVSTSVWGDAVWARCRGDLYTETLMEPLSNRLRIGRSVEKAFGGLPADRKVKLNEAIDSLSAVLDQIRKPLASEKLKTLQGDPQPPSTHELYAWSDRDAARLLGHYDGGTFIVDKLVPHLR
jgi:putative CRISPR-associated protein (TIGR02619 family)